MPWGGFLVTLIILEQRLELGCSYDWYRIYWIQWYITYWKQGKTIFLLIRIAFGGNGKIWRKVSCGNQFDLLRLGAMQTPGRKLSTFQRLKHHRLYHWDWWLQLLKNQSKTQERILKEFDASLARLQLSYVDVIQIHDFEFCQVYIRFNLDFVFRAWLISFGAANIIIIWSSILIINIIAESIENCPWNPASARKDCGKWTGKVCVKYLPVANFCLLMFVLYFSQFLYVFWPSGILGSLPFPWKNSTRSFYWPDRMHHFDRKLAPYCLPGVGCHKDKSGHNSDVRQEHPGQLKLAGEKPITKKGLSWVNFCSGPSSLFSVQETWGDQCFPNRCDLWKNAKIVIDFTQAWDSWQTLGLSRGIQVTIYSLTNGNHFYEIISDP